MIIDKETELATGVALDLESVRPGPGQPIKMWALLDTDDDLEITMGTTAALAVAGATTCITVACSGITEFELPSSTLQFVATDFTGQVAVSLTGIQTSK